MPKLMILSVTGADTEWNRVVSVQDEDEFLGTMRSLALEEAMNSLPQLITERHKDAYRLRMLSNLRLTLTPTDLLDLPTDEREIAAVYRALDVPEEMLV